MLIASIGPGTGQPNKAKICAEQCAACHGEKGPKPAESFDRFVRRKGRAFGIAPSAVSLVHDGIHVTQVIAEGARKRRATAVSI